jgi:hypothetical protein
MYEETSLPQRIEKIGLKTAVRLTSYIIYDEGNFKLKNLPRKNRYYSQTRRIYTLKYELFAATTWYGTKGRHLYTK